MYEEEYLPASVSGSAGFAVTVSEPGKAPNPAEDGFQVSPGSQVNLAFKLQVTFRQSAPYETQCWDAWGETPYQPLYFDLMRNITRDVQEYSYNVSTLVYIFCLPCSDSLGKQSEAEPNSTSARF